MATGSVSISITVPSTNNVGGASGAANASNLIVVGLLNQVAQVIGASGATSGNLVYPPGSNTVVGSFTYSAAT